MDITLGGGGVVDQSYCCAELRISILPSAQHSFDLELSLVCSHFPLLSHEDQRDISVVRLLGHVEFHPHIVEHTPSSVKSQQMTPK